MSLFEEHGVPTVFDLLTIDVDGNDFHLLSSILSAGFAPNVIAVEYPPKNNGWSLRELVFRREGSGTYHAASSAL